MRNIVRTDCEFNHYKPELHRPILGLVSWRNGPGTLFEAEIDHD
jgi:hypothetical protein